MLRRPKHGSLHSLVVDKHVGGTFAFVMMITNLYTTATAAAVAVVVFIDHRQSLRLLLRHELRREGKSQDFRHHEVSLDCAIHLAETLHRRVWNAVAANHVEENKVAQLLRRHTLASGCRVVLNLSLVHRADELGKTA